MALYEGIKQMNPLMNYNKGIGIKDWYKSIIEVIGAMWLTRQKVDKRIGKI